MSERLMLKGALEEKKLRSMKLAIKADGLIRGIKQIIQPAAVTPLRDLRTSEALELIGELDDLKTEYVQVVAEMDEIRRELGE
ncbi:hypothetical protein [Desulfatiglans anilini]|uniref:hypothetical protein n=1 Tax=Desulfatiglans anilini TaxID=90728 RepID=UPI00040FFF53|nr:hypothetical protein [Desulfatiglans anilini]